MPPSPDIIVTALGILRAIRGLSAPASTFMLSTPAGDRDLQVDEEARPASPRRSGDHGFTAGQAASISFIAAFDFMSQPYSCGSLLCR